MDIYRTKQSPSGMLLISARVRLSNNSPGPTTSQEHGRVKDEGRVRGAG